MDKRSLIEALIQHFGHKDWTLINNDTVQLDGSDNVIEIASLNIEAHVENFNKKLKHKARIFELRKMLKDTDYITLSDYDKNKPELIALRQSWREEIRSINNLNMEI